MHPRPDARPANHPETPAPKKSSGPDLLPWQSVVMVACVTLAGLLHENPSVLKPVAAHLQTSALRADYNRAAHSTDLLETVLWLGR